MERTALIAMILIKAEVAAAPTRDQQMPSMLRWDHRNWWDGGRGGVGGGGPDMRHGTSSGIWKLAVQEYS